MPVDEVLIREALEVFDVVEVRSLRDGGQKTVRLVKKDAEELVLKIIAVEPGLKDALRRAQREVELLQSVDSPHVVKVASELVELGTPTVGAAWLEEYLEGEDLRDHVGTQWAWDETATMAADIATGLAALHRGKVVHRDLSSGNIRRLTSGRYVVMDPGFARHTLRSDLTVGGQPGTPGFLSPEHLHAYSGGPTAASDIFCVGILMFLTLSGHLPIPIDDDMADYLARLSRVECLELTDYRNDLSEEALALMAQCLHSQPARRPRNGQRLVEALEVLE